MNLEMPNYSEHRCIDRREGSLDNGKARCSGDCSRDQSFVSSKSIKWNREVALLNWGNEEVGPVFLSNKNVQILTRI